MPEIHIDSITIKNFGPFYGASTIDLGSLEERCGVLLGGKNGAGKTHLLRAIFLAVVGETGIHDLASIERNGSGATGFDFRKSLNRRAEAEGDTSTILSAVITHKDLNGGGSKKITIKRTITHRPSSPPKWDSIVIKPDGTQEYDDSSIQRIRDTWLPRHLARFFFFDAERSQGLNLAEKEIIQGVNRVLGLWAYEELAEDLRNLIDQKIPRVYNSRALPDEERKLSDLTSEIIKIQGHIRASIDEQEALRERKDEAEVRLANIEEELRMLGAVDPSEMERRRLRRDTMKAAKEKLENVIRGAWEKELPLALMGKFRIELKEYLITEEKRNEWERSKATVEPKIPQIKRDVFENAPLEYSLDAAAHAYYSTKLERALKSIFHPPPEGMAERVYVIDRSDISAQVRKILASRVESIQKLSEQLANIETISAELREIDSWLRQNQQSQESALRCGELREKERSLLEQIEDIEKTLDNKGSEQKHLEAQIVELRRQEQNQRTAVEKALQGKSLSSLAARYRETAEEVQKKAATFLREQIGEKVGELWIKIAERDREFIGMQFDEYWRCWLLGANGKKTGWDEVNASAGQRQVRVLAFYEALRRLARLSPPLVVDTPLGRLDKEVRKSVLEELYLSGHQSVILATNSEIDPGSQLFFNIRDRLARVYTLEPHGEPDSTHYTVTVRDDYFGEHL